MRNTAQPLIDKSDQDLMISLKAGDWEAFGAIYKKYWQDLYLVCYNLTRSKPLCEDIIQETFTELWQKKQHRDIHCLKTFLSAAVRYQCYKKLRRQRKLTLTGFDDDDLVLLEDCCIEKDMDAKYLSALMSQQIANLPPKCREIYTLSRFEHLKYREIATLLGVSIKTVENQISIALKKLLPVINKFNS